MTRTGYVFGWRTKIEGIFFWLQIEWGRLLPPGGRGVHSRGGAEGAQTGVRPGETHPGLQRRRWLTRPCEPTQLNRSSIKRSGNISLSCLPLWFLVSTHTHTSGNCNCLWKQHTHIRNLPHHLLQNIEVRLFCNVM